jgi:hypothetical protein
MGHALRAVIGPTGSASDFASRWVAARAVALPQGFMLIPVTDALIDDISELYGSNRPDPFVELSFLSAALADAISQSSGEGPLAYIETDYFGGIGQQNAIAWDGRRVVFGPLTSETKWTGDCVIQPPASEQAINQVLRSMGVWTRGGLDEFDMLGIGEFRDTECAAKAARQ